MATHELIFLREGVPEGPCDIALRGPGHTSGLSATFKRLSKPKMKALKMFDIHTKGLDGVTQQTTIGAIVTLISFGGGLTAIIL